MLLQFFAISQLFVQCACVIVYGGHDFSPRIFALHTAWVYHTRLFSQIFYFDIVAWASTARIIIWKSLQVEIPELGPLCRHSIVTFAGQIWSYGGFDGENTLDATMRIDLTEPLKALKPQKEDLKSHLGEYKNGNVIVF